MDYLSMGLALVYTAGLWPVHRFMLHIEHVARPDCTDPGIKRRARKLRRTVVATWPTTLIIVMIVAQRAWWKQLPDGRAPKRALRIVYRAVACVAAYFTWALCGGVSFALKDAHWPSWMQSSAMWGAYFAYAWSYVHVTSGINAAWGHPPLRCARRGDLTTWVCFAVLALAVVNYCTHDAFAICTPGK